MRLIFVIILFVCFIIKGFSNDIPKYLQDISVTIHAGGSQGTGVILNRTNSEGKIISFILTASHVIDGLRNTREIIAPDGSKRTVVEFQDAQVVKDLIENGRKVGRIQIDAEIIKHSDFEHGEDLAILKVRKTNFSTSSAKFYLEDKILDLGTEVYHCGSLFGEIGSGSITSGIFSQTGRIIDKKVYDVYQVSAVSGSSGGGIFLREGSYVAMLVRGRETFNLVVPIRRIKEWTKKNKIEWVLDPSVPLPSDEDFEKIPIEDAGKFSLLKSKSENEKDTKKSVEFPYLIQNNK